MKRTDLFAALLAAAALGLWLGPFARVDVDPHHDGIMLKTALDVFGGQTLFRDTFSQYGALTTYLQVAALSAHPTLLCLKLMTVAAYAATLFVLYASWRLILPRSLTWLACGLFLLFLPGYERNWLGGFWVLLPWSSVLAMFFQAVAVYALMRVILDDQARRWGLLLGMACAATFWCRQPVGVLLTGMMAVIGLALHGTGWNPARSAKRDILLWTIGGFAGVNLLLVGSIAASGALEAWWYQNYTWPRKWALGEGKVGWHSFEVFLHPGQAAALFGFGVALALPALARRLGREVPRRGMVIYYAVLAAVAVWQRDRLSAFLTFRDGGWTVLFPAVIVAQAIASIAQGFRPRPGARPVEYHLVAALAAVSLSSLPQYFPVPDAWHVFWSLAPAFGLVVYALWRWSSAPALAVTLLVTAALVPSVFLKARLARELLGQPLVTLETPAVLRGLRVPPAKAAAFDHITRTLDPILRQHPDLPAVMIGNDALYLCFVPNRTNPSPYFVTWPNLAEAPANQARWDFVARVRPVMLMHQANWSAVNDFYRRARYVPLLYLPDETLEIAVPQELAEAMGLKVYGANPTGAPAQETPKP
jgi:hypothetical protein